MLSTRTRSKARKSVRWPDQVAEDDEDAAFRIGRPRQLEIVHLVSGLGPGPSDDSDSGGSGSAVHSHSTFAAAVRAEHSSEKQQMLLNHSG
jgi:hypothetical protein